MKRILGFSLLLLLATEIVYAQNIITVPSASLFMWTDKVVYSPNEPITVRWTGRTNGDTTPYTVVVYLQNNQTGAKTYFSMGSAPTTTTVDITGKTPDQGFTPVQWGDVDKDIILGSGGWLAPQLFAPSDLGMHTIVAEIRDTQGNRVVKAAYAKFGVVSNFETVSGDISADTTLVNTKAYMVSGVVTVKNNATLTIEPGTIIMGEPGSQPPSVLLIGVNGLIHAVGTRSRPIIMTSSLPVGERQPGDWGGLILLGKAQVNVEGGVSNIEGLPPSPDTTFGGTENTGTCGELAYVRVEFGGITLSPNNEINNFTFGGCGSGTIAHHLQSRYGLDDHFEWFGGTMDAKYLAGDIGRDDNLDGQLGWSGRVQHGIMLAGIDVQGNRGIEMDNSEFDDRAIPQGKPQIYNVTFVGSGDVFTTGFDESDSAGLYLRRGAGGAYNNLLVYNWIVNGVSIRDNSGSTATLESIQRGDLSMNGIMMWDNGKASGRPNTIDGQAADFGTTSNQMARDLLHGVVGNGKNVVVTDPMMRRPLYRSDPDFLPKAISPIFRANWVQPPDDGFFDQWANWTGGFGDVDWTQEWTTWAQEGDLK